jgi:putative transposase
MNYDLDKGKYSVYSLYYHFIYVVNTETKIFTNGAVVDFLKAKTGEIAYTFNVDMPDTECDKCHFHMLFKAISLLNISRSGRYRINALCTET